MIGSQAKQVTGPETIPITSDEGSSEANKLRLLILSRIEPMIDFIITKYPALVA